MLIVHDWTVAAVVAMAAAAIVLVATAILTVLEMTIKRTLYLLHL